MRFLCAQVENFGSYKELSFDFSNLGLALIQGATGTGKSTLQDVPCWILYGITSKEGVVDDVKSWVSGGDPTKGTLEVELPDGLIKVTRVRGKASENDLYWTENDHSTPIRGKDITETQKLLEKRINFPFELYVSGAYFSEFSPTSSFFTSKPKDKRELFERLANLEFVTDFSMKISDARLVTKRNITGLQSQLDSMSGQLHQLHATKEQTLGFKDSWYESQQDLIEEIQRNADTFEETKLKKLQQIQVAIDLAEENKITHVQRLQLEMSELTQQIKSLELKKCPTCGRSDNTQELSKLTHQLNLKELTYNGVLHQTNPHGYRLAAEQAKENPYHRQLAVETKKTNPYIVALSKIESDIDTTSKKIEAHKHNISEATKRYTGLDQLYDISFTLRGLIIQKTIKEIEYLTNTYLDSYFDADLRLSFEIEPTTDNIQLTITKNGYECNYKQLSKGQRGVLKLSFAVAVMSIVSSHSGVQPSILFFDEALDGFDADLKVKSFRLFQELSKRYESILLIDHATEFKTMFERQFHVSMESDLSSIVEV